MSIFPFIDAETIESDASEEQLPVFREYAYDFTENKLLLDKNGKTYLVERNEALKIWIYKALTTARFRYTAYSSNYGSEHEDNLLGQYVSKDIFVSELERYIIETLMVNPYIEEVNNFSFEESSTGMNASFDCLTVYGKERITLPTEGVST